MKMNRQPYIDIIQTGMIVDQRNNPKPKLF